ncbi:MAG: hypothetical protein KDC24_10460 [Saprospiraceae bacterium]|nr:hypothetical protein [Saprospiraceae bacterium]
MKTKLTVLTLMAFVHFLPAQNFVEYRVFSEVTSVLRGNRSANISVEIQRNAHLFGFGFDYFFANHHHNRTIRGDKFSNGGYFKYSYNPNIFKKNIPFYAGLYVKLQKMYMETYLKDWYWYTNQIYHVKYDVIKFVPMGFLQYNFYPKEHLLVGIQAAAGFPLILKTDPYDKTTDDSGFEPENEKDIWKLHLYEHGFIHDTNEPTFGIAFQLNVLVGYRF